MERERGRIDNASMAKSRKQKPVRHYVKQWRKKRDLTQERLAERVDRSRGLISQIETGETELTEEMIYALADALRADPGDLFDVNPEKEGLIVDITDLLRGKSAAVQAEVLGFVRGLVRSAS
jgi:transcriptional regulator with XRE-family HTH domain